jgi:hypothetical protein
MSCRDFSQPSFAEAFVTGYTRGGGVLEDIDQAFDWSAFEVLLTPRRCSNRVCERLSKAPEAPGAPFL